MAVFDFTVGAYELEFIPSPSPDEENRRRRRRIWNRESARRSCMRRIRRLDDLRSEVERLQEDNRCLAGRLRATIYGSIQLRRDNARLRSESTALRQMLRRASRGYLYTSCRWLSCLPPPPPPPPSSAAAADMIRRWRR